MKKAEKFYRQLAGFSDKHELDRGENFTIGIMQTYARHYHKKKAANLEKRLAKVEMLIEHLLGERKTDEAVQEALAKILHQANSLLPQEP